MFAYNFISNLVFGVSELNQSNLPKTAQIPTKSRDSFSNSSYCSNHKHVKPHLNFYQQNTFNKHQHHSHYHQYNKHYSNKKSSSQKARYSKAPKMPPTAYSTFHAHSTTASAY
ncbi:8618_t:CDS:1, partial [Racocetra persica]